ncbi:hypothetical protein ACTXT7_000030 [Hymenolepis weldensis]
MADLIENYKRLTTYEGLKVIPTPLPRLIKRTSPALEHSGKCGRVTDRAASKRDVRAEALPANQRSISLRRSSAQNTCMIKL